MGSPHPVQLKTFFSVIKHTPKYYSIFKDINLKCRVPIVFAHGGGYESSLLELENEIIPLLKKHLDINSRLLIDISALNHQMIKLLLLNGAMVLGEDLRVTDSVKTTKYLELFKRFHESSNKSDFIAVQAKGKKSEDRLLLKYWNTTQKNN